jgi:hypothetical protein
LTVACPVDMQPSVFVSAQVSEPLAHGSGAVRVAGGPNGYVGALGTIFLDEMFDGELRVATSGEAADDLMPCCSSFERARRLLPLCHATVVSKPAICAPSRSKRAKVRIPIPITGRNQKRLRRIRRIPAGMRIHRALGLRNHLIARAAPPFREGRRLDPVLLVLESRQTCSPRARVRRYHA